MVDPERPSDLPDRRDGRQGFRPLIFGEVLFDHFQDGSKVLGGAPFNVAWHLRGFKASPLVITAVGNDREGREILERMGEWGMDTSGVQIHPTRPTGRVSARLEDGEPHYSIEPRQAYDAVSVEGLPPRRELSVTDLLYHGSLGTREATSAQALDFLRTHFGLPVLVDVNLRDPWWSVEGVSAHLAGARWVKMNRTEARLLSQLPVRGEDGLLAAATALRGRFGIETLVITLGGDGAVAVEEGGVHRRRAPRVADLVDPVGAGDAFSAVLAQGIHGGWGMDTTLRRATEFAAELCRTRGATARDPSLYARYLGRWFNAT